VTRISSLARPRSSHVRHHDLLALIDLDSSHSLLEVGCGPGVLAGLIAGRLMTGSLTALDRSPTAIARAGARNRAYLVDNRLVLLQYPLATAPLPKAAFDHAIAQNVNAFWRDGKAELSTLRRALRPDARLDLAYDLPSTDRQREIAQRLHDTLAACGFEVVAQTTAPTFLHFRATPCPWPPAPQIDDNRCPSRIARSREAPPC
jgi:SAM-dependent methyltransferase